MDSKEIKETKDFLYKQISDAEIELKALRTTCPHINTKQGLYSYRAGSIQHAIICEDCGDCIKFII